MLRGGVCTLANHRVNSCILLGGGGAILWWLLSEQKGSRWEISCLRLRRERLVMAFGAKDLWEVIAIGISKDRLGMEVGRYENHFAILSSQVRKWCAGPGHVVVIHLYCMEQPIRSFSRKQCRCWQICLSYFVYIHSHSITSSIAISICEH
jgi:hypothetical protein